MIQPLSLQEFMALGQSSSRIALFTVLKCSALTAMDIYDKFAKSLKNGVILENLYQDECPVFSYLLFEPFAKLEVKDKMMTETIEDKITKKKGNPFSALRELQKKLSFSTRPAVAKLISSAMGFVTYDAVRYIEPIPDRHQSEGSVPDILFQFYRIAVTLVADNEIIISILVDVSDEPEKDYAEAQIKLKYLIGSLEKTADSVNTQASAGKALSITEDISQAEFMQMVMKAKDYILRGDAFQVVLSRCFKLNYSASPISIYQSLRQVSPSPFMFFFPIAENWVMGASPERLVRVYDQEISINPIAGTRKREGIKNDASIAADLLHDEKEIAEHMMLVDLARNDVGVVAKPGTVKVDDLLKVKHYSHVSHITSLVTGELQTGLDSIDALIAAFPAGTLSGAPKIRAMEIIDELETSRRGLYGGAICRFDYAGNLDSCIAIRMAFLDKEQITIRAGAGIVHDSDPRTEAEETQKKANALCLAVQHAHGVSI